METELGNPIEYNAQVMDKELDRDDSEPIQNHLRQPDEDQQYYYNPPNHQQYMGPPQPSNEPLRTNDILSSLDKVAYIVIFVAFILGFFMGKTMQPVILRHG
jgi:hypothetical protein|tara:strand:- start:270 stop:575 length:306 start_codon:yes stop_codon:yes gene_type:complete